MSRDRKAPTRKDAGNHSKTRLLTPKQEAFALAYVETGNASEAYRRAYDVKPNASTNSVHVCACELLKHHKVSVRIAELQAEAARSSQITVERLTDMALDAYKAAKDAPTPQASAMVKCAEFLGKLHGIVVEKREIEDGPRKAAAAAENRARIAELAERLGYSRPAEPLGGGAPGQRTSKLPGLPN